MGHFVWVFLGVIIMFSAAQQQTSLRPRGAFSAKNPAFVSVIDNTLFFTSFSGSPFTDGSIFSVANFAEIWRGNVSDATPVALQTAGLKWPNNITPAPFGGFIFGDGFLPPGKSDGGIYWIQNGTLALHRLTAEDKGWFYHRGVFFDVNGDGLEDIITARAKKPLFGKGLGELLWLEQPSDPTQLWPSHKLADGPDIDVRLYRSEKMQPGEAVIFAAEFFGRRLSSFILANGSVTSSNVIDDAEGEMYSVTPGHVFGNGTVTLLADNYEYNGNGTIFLYTANDATASASAWTKTIVSSAFHNRQYAPGSGAPGWIYPHYPRASQNAAAVSQEQQSFFVCGDGDEAFHLFSPSSTSGGWTETFRQDFKSTVGAAALGDFDQDGWLDVVVTDYNNNLIHAYTYAPQ